MFALPKALARGARERASARATRRALNRGHHPDVPIRDNAGTRGLTGPVASCTQPLLVASLFHRTASATRICCTLGRGSAPYPSLDRL